MSLFFVYLYVPCLSTNNHKYNDSDSDFVVALIVVFIVALCSSIYSNICSIICSSICSIFTSLPSVQDRCVSEPGYCSQLCQDSMTEGRKCSCNLGYSLAPDGRTCGGQYSYWYTSLSYVTILLHFITSRYHMVTHVTCMVTCSHTAKLREMIFHRCPFVSTLCIFGNFVAPDLFHFWTGSASTHIASCINSRHLLHSLHRHN